MKGLAVVVEAMRWIGTDGGDGADRLVGGVKETKTEDQVADGSRHEDKGECGEADPHPAEGVRHRIHYCCPWSGLPQPPSRVRLPGWSSAI